MAITSIKIHPAIGIARLGNSPDEFFIGPERLWEPPDPAGGFKDGKCRVKRQAARFRVFAYHDDGSRTEITAAEADITWTVHLANKKAVMRNDGAPATDVTIDPGSRTLDGPDQRKEFDNGQVTFPGTSTVTVPLGEIRTDDESHLLVLGGSGTSATPSGAPIEHFADNPGWYDDVADGPVTAHVTLHDSGNQFEAAGAWVIVAPPKFAPQLENVITLYDAVFQMAVEQVWLAGPAVPSYTNDVYPILQRARAMRWVTEVLGSHTWADPVYDQSLRQAIFNKLKNPSGGGGDMPLLIDATLTPTQFGLLQQWKDGNFTPDWNGPPVSSAQITPEGLDRVALTSCVGAAFFPGIEAGGLTVKPIIDPGKYVGASDPMRPHHGALAAGDLTQHMAVPWQADFKACANNWWPVPRPNDVIPQGTATPLAWDRDVGSPLEMVSEWHALGFVVQQGGEYFEVDRCDMTFVTLLTPHLNFQDVAQGPMGMSRKVKLAIVFEVRSPGAAVTLEVQPGEGPSHPRLTLDPASDTVGPTMGNEIATARLGVGYETGSVGENISDQVTVRQVGSDRTWVVTITAATVGRKVAAAALVLDRSGSMAEDRGDGQTKHQALKEAASIFIDVMLEGDGVGVVGYNHDAQALQGVTPLGPPGQALGTQQVTKDTIAGPNLAPSGATSIGDGIFEGRQLLDGAGPGYALRALVVLTDGKENNPRWISDVAPEISERTYAVGLGTPENTSAPALQAVSGNHGGYLLVTGPITGDNQFVLQKYFLQILSGISNAEIVLDPDGVLVSGVEQRIPFSLTEADTGVEVILLSPNPEVVDFRLQTPNGFVLEPWRAATEPGMRWVLSQGVSYYRLVLPTELLPARYDQAGTWHVLVSLGKPRLSPREQPVRSDRPDHGWVGADVLRRVPPRRAAAIPMASGPALSLRGGQATLPYSIVVHAYSDLSLRPSLVQSGFEPGAIVALEATLSEAGMPARLGASVWTEVTRPDGTAGTVVLNEIDPGRFAASFPTSISGVYRCRIRASGRSRAGYPFQREHTLTAAVWHGGDHDADSNAAYLRRCLAVHCPGPAGDENEDAPRPSAPRTGLPDRPVSPLERGPGHKAEAVPGCDG
jgi:hypothetical protein